jgi:hypothetical protein
LSLLVVDLQHIAAANEWTVPQTVPDPLPALDTSRQRPYGFLNAYTGYFLHVGNTENEINELGVDAETLSPHERRVRRSRHEVSKWDPEHYMYVVPFSCPPKQPKNLKTKKKNNHIDSIIDHHLPCLGQTLRTTHKSRTFSHGRTRISDRPQALPTKSSSSRKPKTQRCCASPGKNVTAFPPFSEKNKQLSERVSPTIKTSPPPKKRTTST